MIAHALLLACLGVCISASTTLAIAGIRARPRAPFDLAAAYVGAMLAFLCAAAAAAALGV